MVSPHRDDAAFSCAISIRFLLRFGTVLFSNYFTISEYAPFRTSEKGTVSAIRKEEDSAFGALAKIMREDLDLVDAPQRLSVDVSQLSTTRPFDNPDWNVIQAIRSHVAQLHPELILAPLAMGNHIDHRIAQAAVLETGICRLAFYEDLPYSARLDAKAPEERASNLGLDLSPFLITAVDGQEWKARCAALYPSQINMETVHEIANYSTRFGNGERLWVTPSAHEWITSHLPA